MKDTAVPIEIFHTFTQKMTPDLKQGQIHPQVFSTAPIDNVLAEMKDRLQEVQN